MVLLFPIFLRVANIDVDARFLLLTLQSYHCKLANPSLWLNGNWSSNMALVHANALNATFSSDSLTEFARRLSKLFSNSWLKLLNRASCWLQKGSSAGTRVKLGDMALIYGSILEDGMLVSSILYHILWGHSLQL